MKVKINNFTWLIKYASSDEVKAVFNDNNPDSYYFGSTVLSKQEVLINKEATKEKQKETLYHELMHVYLYSYVGDSLQSFNEEDLSCISAKSHDLIHKICKDFFELEGEKNEY